MKLVSYKFNNTISIGAITNEGIFPATSHYDGKNGLMRFLEDGDAALLELGNKINASSNYLSPDDVQLLTPITKPNKFFGVSLNYADHIEETGLDRPEYPTFFNKQNSCVIGPGDAIHRPKVSEKLDYEAELGIVIGKRCRHVSREQTASVIAAYTIVNDVSVRVPIHGPWESLLTHMAPWVPA